METLMETLKAPVFITPRLCAGVRIDDVTISVEHSGTFDSLGKAKWLIHFDGPDWTATESGLAGRGNSTEMVKTALSFLEACAESIAYSDRTGRPGENADLFSPTVARWASRYSDEIAFMQLWIEEPEIMD